MTKNITFLLFCALLMADTAAQQTITVTKNANEFSAVGFNTKEVPVENLNTSHDISLRFEDVLFQTIQKIEVFTPSGRATEMHNGGTSTTIIGKDDTPVLTINIHFSDGTIYTIDNVGKKPTAVITVDLQSSLFDCGCDLERTTNATEKIIEALKLCPDCGTEDQLVYDVQCGNLYSRINNRLYKRVTDARKVKFFYKKEFKVKLIHVNRYITDVTVKAEDIEYKSTAPTIFNEIFGSTGSFVTDLTKAISAHSGMDSTAPSHSLSSLKDSISQFSNTLNELGKDINNLKEIRNLAYSQCCESKVLCGQKHSFSLSGFMSKIFSAEVYYNQLMFVLNGRIRQRGQLETKLKSLKEELIKTTTAPGKITLQEQIQSVQDTLNTIPDNLSSVVDQVNAMWSAFKKIDEKQLNSLAIFNDNYLKQNFVFSTPSIYPSGNRMSINVTTKLRDSLFIFKEGLRPLDDRSIVVEGLVLKKWFVSFSSGPFVGFGNDLYATSYESQAIPGADGVIDENSSYRIAAVGKTATPIGLSGMAHFQRRFQESLSWGISIGAGITAESKPKIVYLLGPSFFVGDKHQFALTVGFAGMQVDHLKTSLYPAGSIYSSRQEDLKYSKNLKLGGFVALTYTLFTP